MKTLVVNRKCFTFILVALLISFTRGSYGQTITASVQEPLTEANLHGSVVTLTLTGGTYEQFFFEVITVSGIDSVTFESWSIERVSDTEVALELEFYGNIDADGTLTFTVEADAITDYNGNALNATLPVTAVEESLTASTAAPLTESTLDGGIITLTLTGRQFIDDAWDIADAVSVSGIDGVTVTIYGGGVDRVSDTVVTVAPGFSGNIDTDATLTLAVGADAIVGYDKSFTFQFPVTAVEESLTASTEFPLTEATLDSSIITLSLSGRRFAEWWTQEDRAVSGIDGVTLGYVERVSDTEIVVLLEFDSTDFDTDATLTFTVGASMANYNQALTAQVPVTAIQQSNATVSISPLVVVSPAVGEELRFSLNITGGENVTSYQATVLFDSTALQPIVSFDSEDGIVLDSNVFSVSFTNGDYLPAGAFFADPIVVEDWLGDTSFGEPIWSTKVILAANTLAGAANGDGTLATLTFKVVDFKPSTVTLSQVYLVDSDGKRWEATTQNGTVTIPPEPAEPILGDINRDGVVDILDLTIVGARFNQRGQNSADLNGDGLVDIVDLVLVAGAFDAEAAAPSAQPQVLELFTAADVRQWLNQAQGLHPTDTTFQSGIRFLEQLLTALTPKETTLLPNYPNPFNPETWIPYHLSNDADVQISIYDTKGVLVRRLDLGHQMAGYYTDRAKAAYWNGRNESGESVANGLYFYQLRAGGYTALRRMVIVK